MPPKKKKGRKLTKAEKAKLALEAEERRLQEEEEAKLQAEREEQENLNRQRKAKEIAILEIKDLERREGELNELRRLLEENHISASKWKTDAVEKVKWERYMRCDGSPDPEVQQEINAFITLLRDDPAVDVTLVLKQCILALQMVEELEVLFIEATNPEERQKYQESLINLQDIIYSKHLQITEEIVKSASENIDTETGNMQTVVGDDNITLCLWANLKKNPRFKGYTFEDVGLGFQLPKLLAVSNIAVRILHTRYDHLSMLVRMTHLTTHTSGQRSLAGDEEVPEGLDLPEQGEGGETEGTGENKIQLEKMDEDVRSIQAPEEQKGEVSEQSRTNGTQFVEEGLSDIETQMETIDAERDETSSPVQQNDQGVQVVDLMKYTPLGGVFYCETFLLPPQAHQANGWKIRQLLDNGLQVFPYPGEQLKLDDNEEPTCPLVGLSLTIPNSIIFLDTPQVALWDPEGKLWRMDGITDISYDKEESKISFKMESFKAFVLMQETCANLPLKSWELKPLGQDSALFTLNGAVICVSITIQGNECMLQSEEVRGLAHLVGKWMSFPKLQKAMLKAGINMFVNEYTDKYTSTCGKDPLSEHAAYEQMALFASSCAFSWSKWNAKCGAEHLVMQVCEHYGPNPVPIKLWGLYLLRAQRCQKLEITEENEIFSTDHYPGSDLHSTFIHTLQDSMSAEGITRTRKSNYMFVDTVQSVLCATRPLMFS